MKKLRQIINILVILVFNISFVFPQVQPTTIPKEKDRVGPSIPISPKKRFKEIIELKYADAKNGLGDIQSIRNTFIGFQEHVYESNTK